MLKTLNISVFAGEYWLQWEGKCSGLFFLQKVLIGFSNNVSKLNIIIIIV